jgi:uncharacterized Zn-binding protein involved in type VI secretion
MAEAAAKQGDRIVSDGTSKVWVQPPAPANPIAVPFSYGGSLDSNLASDVLIMGKPAAVVGSTAENAIPPHQQPPVTAAGTVLSTVDNSSTISVGSSSVLIHGESAARNGDKAKTWDYSTPASPGVGKEVENAQVIASGSVIIGN